MSDTVKIVLQWIIVVWFVVLAAVVLVPAIQLLEADSAVGVTCPHTCPTPPAAPALDATAPADARQQLVTLYQQNVTLYTTEMTAYSAAVKANSDAATKPARLAIYTAVVHDTLVSLLTPLVTAFLGFIFVKGAATLVNNRIKAKANPNAPISDLTFFS